MKERSYPGVKRLNEEILSPLIRMKDRAGCVFAVVREVTSALQEPYGGMGVWILMLR